MARARSENRDKAKILWEKSNGNKPLREIALELGVSETQVRKWKSVDKWGKLTLPFKSNKSITKKTNKKKAISKETDKKATTGTTGNKKEPKKNKKDKKIDGYIGNKNSVSTGEFERIFYSTMTEEEKALIGTLNYDKALMLQEEIALFTVREHRIMARIKVVMANKFVATGVNTTIHKGSSDDITGNFTTKNADSSESFLLKLEQSLTNIQEKKTRAIETLAKIEQGYMKLQLERDIFEFEKGDEKADTTGINNFIEATKVSEDDMNKLFEIKEVEYEEVK